MNEAHTSVDSAIKESETLRRLLKRKTTRQVTSSEERDLIKATSLAWFNNHYLTVDSLLGAYELIEINELYKELLSCSDRSTSRTKYDELLKIIKKTLAKIRTNTVTNALVSTPEITTDQPPDYSRLIGDVRIQSILQERWIECSKCVNAEAPLAATVMMGGLLETLLLARFNSETDKAKIFSTKTAPIDRKSGKAMPINKWTLRHYIDVAHELKWISESARNVGEVLRDYRNYVHPYKQLAHGVTLDSHDAKLFWEITKSISRQLLDKAK
ncbi:MAG: hypothetical protein OEY89_16020 [Gammaproteobacteria bacterium]|nr:hypothetical protein [Gammaproteobacteria bacterium]